MRAAAIVAATLGLSLCAWPVAPVTLAQSSGDDGWNPFKLLWPEQRQPRRPPPPPVREGGVPGGAPADRVNMQPGPFGSPSRPVESTDLSPVLAPDASGLPLELWRGLDLKALEELLASLSLPPRSSAMHQLWRRMLLSSANPPVGIPSPDHFVALRLEALYRSGLLADMTEVLEKSGASSALLQALAARKDIGVGAREAGCRSIKTLAAPSSGLPGRLKGETQLLAGYCAAIAGDTAAAGLAADLAREEGIEADVPIAVLAAFAGGTKPRLQLPKRVLLLDYRFLELMGPVDAAHIFDKAEPALLAALASDAAVDVRLRTAGAEAALRLHALAPEAVADIYRQQVVATAAASSAQGERLDPLVRRARLYQTIEFTARPDLKARLVRAMLEDARRAGVHLQTARMLDPLLAALPPGPDMAPLAEPALEGALAAGEFERARRWATTRGLEHWLALIDIADPSLRDGRPPGMMYVEELVARGRLSAEALHRLATVLDALDFEVPMAVWEAASRSPQPATGFLPETGVLADLKQSAQRKDVGRAILLAMRTLGPAGADGANILALGDALRALRRIGMEADARRLGLEALFDVWPRTAGN